jgi:hypothetical protein
MLIVQEHKQLVEASTSGNCIRVDVDDGEMIDDDVDDDPLPLPLPL